MTSRPFRRLKLLIYPIIFFFCWTNLGIYNIVQAATNDSGKSQVASSKGKTTEEKFQESIERIRDGVDKEDVAKLKTEKAEIENLDVEIKKEFKATEQKIKDLPETIKQRHRDFVNKYEENLNTLKTNLNEIDKAKTKEEKKQAHQKTKDFLEKTKPPSRHIPLDPNKLPHRMPEIKKKEPRTKPEEFKEFKSENGRQYAQIPSNPPLLKGEKGGLGNPILVASNGSLTGLLSPNSEVLNLPLPAAGEGWGEGNLLLAQATTNLPTPADLAETIEVQFTPDIKAKAAELNYNPVKIYEWVRNNIEFVPTYGSIQGADMCLQTKQCNDIDTASLLIALLRTSNISARYVYGTIELPIDKVMNWVGGFTDPNSAANFIASGGIPIKAYTSGGKISKVQMEHVWVEAHVDYIPSRGAIHNQGDTWIPLDASFKQYTYKRGMDVQQITGFNAQGFIDQITSKSTTDSTTGSVTNIPTTDIQTQMETIKTSLKTYIDTNLPADATVGDVIGSKDIIQQSFKILAASLPNKVIATGTKFTEISGSYRHKITIAIEDPYGFITPLSYTVSLPEIAAKRLSLAYMPATQSDAQTLTTYGYYKVKPYLVNLKPVLYVDGVSVATGGSVGVGEMQDISVTFTLPNGSTDRVTHKVPASTYASIGLDLQRIPKELLDKRNAKLELAKNQLGQQDVNIDDIIGETLNLHSLGYFYQLEATNRISANGKVAYTKQPAEMLSTLSPSISYLYGVPYSISSLGMNVDVKRYILSPVSLSGDTNQIKAFMGVTGSAASATEHAIFEQTRKMAVQGVSAVKIISVANQQGIPIYTIDSANSATILPRLQISSQTMADIKNAIAAGKRVAIPERTIQYYDWRGEGYIITDPNTGAGAYMISGGLAGGGTAEKADVMGLSFDELMTAISYFVDASLGFIDKLQYFSKLVPKGVQWIIDAFGNFLAVVSAFAQAYDMYENTKCQWKTGAAAGIDFTLSILSGMVIGSILYMFLAFSVFWAIAIPLIVALLVATLFYYLTELLMYLIEIIPYCLYNRNNRFYFANGEVPPMDKFG